MVRRVLFWILGIIVVLALVIFLAFQLSPWPSVAIIQQVFSRGDQASEAALEKYVPDNIITRQDLTYGEGRDEIFDVNYPEGTQGPLPTIVWVHGGGWVAGSKQGVANYLKILTGHGYTTIGLEYAHGFGVTYPGPVEQVNAALGYLVANAAEYNIDPQTIILAGDSAGAQIAAQIALLTTDPAYASEIGIAPTLSAEQLNAVILVSGAYDIANVALGGEYGGFVKTVLWAYSGTKNFMSDARFKLASITEHVTDAFPPAFVSSGNGDPLAPQAKALVERLEALGVETDSLFFPTDYSPTLPHEYQFNLDIEAGRQALERILAFTGARTSSRIAD
ncbi:lipase [Devosia nitrariae]|uniref:Lipase n=1 Tax=Devosia nitrariae TaxID=2071872 RepID=A0ABQ5VZH9_9HYPH|nr:lipase [Devosia nitrariae]